MGLRDRLFGSGEREPKPSDSGLTLGRKPCPQCGRALLPGMLTCPFCAPQQLGAAEDEDTETLVLEDGVPHSGVVAMAGIVAATDLATRHGAKGFLHVFEGESKGMSLLLGDRPVRIGRASENPLCLKDPGVSAVHAEVRPVGEGYAVYDLGSKNGTYVDDERVPSRTLANGDVISCGQAGVYVGIL